MEPASGRQPSPSRTPPTFVWVVLCGLLIIIVFYALANGGKLSLGAGPVTVQYDSPLNPQNAASQVNPQQVATNRQNIASQASQIQNTVNASAQSFQPAQLNVAGDWTGVYGGQSNGLRYVVTQQGAAIGIQEWHPQYGVTAVGFGTISSQDIAVSYTTIFNTTGNMTMRVAADARRIDGQATDQVTGMSEQVVMVR